MFGALERRLFLTTVVGLLPLAALAFGALFQAAQRQKRELFESYEGTMRAVVTAVDSELAESLSSLDALAASPRLAADDFESLHNEALELLARRPSWRNIVLSDANARQLMNAYLPLGSPLPDHVYPEAIEETVHTGEPGVGNVIYSPVLHAFALSVRVPVVRAGRTRYVLTAVLRPDPIQQILSSQRMPDNGLAVVVDRSYNVVARTLNAAEYFGKPASDGLVKLLGKRRDAGWDITNTLEGLPVYTIYYRSPRTGWSAAIGIPTGALDAPVRRSYVMLVALVAASMLLGLVASRVVSRTLTRPMRELKDAADAIGEGHAPQLPATDLPEITRVAQALAAAHAQRETLLESERSAREREHDARVLAEQASRTKDEFIAMLGHELRNPLAAVTSASLVLEESLRDADVGEPATNATAIIRRQTRHLARLTDDLLDAGRVVIGRIHLDRQPLELGAMVRGALEALGNAHRLGDHEFDAAFEPVWVSADATRLDQIVTNLLTNAVKYTPTPGKIHVRVERDGPDAVLRVRDGGIGIEPELLPRIFELFVQGPRALDRAQGGLGIGLTLVRRLVELHGGSIAADSPGPGRGSEFTVRLPVLETRGVAPSAIDRRDAPPQRIAIVEDKDDVRASLKQLLELDGHQVIEATDGRSGLELILRERPDLALIDIGLPGIDGLEVARALRAGAAGAATRLVAVTGYGGPADLRDGLEAGFEAYLVKPVDARVLRALIARIATAAERPVPRNADAP